VTQLARNVATTYAARFAIVCSGIFLFPFVTHHVGLSQYGLWLLVNGVTVFFLTADFGMGTSVVRYVAEAHAEDDIERMNGVIASTFAFYLGLGVLAATLFAGCFALFWGAFNIPEADRGVAAQMVALVAIGQLLVGLPLGVFRQTLVGLQRMDLVNAIMLGQTVVRVGGVTAVILAGGGILGVVVVEVLAFIIVGATSFVLCHRLQPGLRVRVRRVSVPLLKSMAPYSAQVFVIGIAALAILQTDDAIISLFLPVAAVAIYGGAWRIYQVCRDVAEAVMGAVVPHATRAGAQGRRDVLRDIHVRWTKYSNAVLLALAVPAIVFAEPVLVLWLGDRFAEAGAVAQILVAGMLLNNIHIVGTGLLTGLGRISAYARYQIAWAVGNLIVSVALVQWLGLRGVALGSVLPLIALEPLFVRAALRVLDQHPGRFIGGALIRPYGAALMALPVLVLPAIALRPDTLAPILGLSLVWLGVFTGCFWIVGLDVRERGKVATLVRRRTPRAARGLVPRVLRPERS
jgi:O-antigen/teichoic acid export membrane protein